MERAAALLLLTAVCCGCLLASATRPRIVKTSNNVAIETSNPQAVRGVRGKPGPRLVKANHPRVGGRRKARRPRVGGRRKSRRPRVWKGRRPRVGGRRKGRKKQPQVINGFKPDYTRPTDDGSDWPNWKSPPCTTPSKRSPLIPRRFTQADSFKKTKYKCGDVINYQYFNRLTERKQYQAYRAKKIDTIVLHEGNSAMKLVKSKRWKNRGISTHFVIERDGTVFQLMDLRWTANHASGLANVRSIGIDLETSTANKPCLLSDQDSKADHSATRYTEALIKSLGKLVDCLVNTYKMKKDYAHIVAHWEVGNKHGDPRYFPWVAAFGFNAAQKKRVGWAKKYGPTANPQY